ncbi:MAG: hypothetical protein WBF53_09510 [Litorimonas sp.]
MKTFFNRGGRVLEAAMGEADDANHADKTIHALAEALSEGAVRQEVAARRLSGLSETISRLEGSRREADRLALEADRLRDALQAAETRVNEQTAWASEQGAKYAAVKAERDDLRRQLEAVTADHAKASDALMAMENEYGTLKDDMADLRANLRAESERADMAELSKAKLAEAGAERAATLSAQSHRLSALQRENEDLSARLSDKINMSETAQTALRELRTEQAATKEQLIEVQNALQAAEYRLSRQEETHEEAGSRRSDEITTLRRQVEQLTAELRIKNATAAQLDRDISSMLVELQTVRERADRNESRLRESASTEARQAQALARAKMDFDALSDKYTESLREIEQLRKVNQMQRDKLERYAQVGSAPAPRSINSPEPVRPVRVVTGGKA